MDTGLKVAEMYLKHRNKAQPPRRKQDEVAADNTEKREVRVPPTPPPRQKIYNYEMPLNPIIPLTHSEGGEQPRYVQVTLLTGCPISPVVLGCSTVPD